MRLPSELCSAVLSLSLLATAARAGSFQLESDLELHLQLLGAPRAAERGSAQRWLSVHLGSEDLASVAEAARGGGAEIRRRLALAVGAEDRLLGLAVLLSGDIEPQVAAVGEAAVVEMLARWSTSSLDPPARRRTFPDPWSEDWPRPMGLLSPGPRVAPALDRLARLGGGPAPLVLDPKLDPTVARTPRPRSRNREAFEGPWVQLVSQLTRVHGVSFEVYGWRAQGQQGSEGARPWVRVGRRGDEGRPGQEHILAWCKGCLREHDVAWNAACARALASLDWPAAVAWLEQLWVTSDNAAALEGLLLAAARGRVAPALCDPQAWGNLLLRVDQALAGGGLHASSAAERLARALAHVPVTSSALDTALTQLLQRWSTVSDRALWMRLVILEGIGRTSLEATSAVEQVLYSEAAAGLRIQALRTLARTAPVDAPGPRLGEVDALFLRAGAAGGLRELVRDLVAVGAVPVRPLAGARSHAERIAFLSWCVASGEQDLALDELRALLGLLGGVQLAQTVESWAGTGRREATTLVLRRAREQFVGDDRVRLGRLLIHSGLASQADQDEVFGGLVTPVVEGPILLDIAALCAAPGPRGVRARDLLHSALEQGASPAVLQPAVELALRRMLRARLDAQAAALEALLRSTAVRLDHALAPVMFGLHWPPAVAYPAPSLDALDRSFGP